jgi:hypothetical protein
MNKISIKTLKEIENQFGEFDLGQVGGSKDVYLRFGYWKQVDLIKLQELIGSSIRVYEDEDFDDDTGWNYSYKLK